MKKKIISALLCVSMVANMAVGWEHQRRKKRDAKEQKTEESKEDKEEVNADSVFGKALAQVDEDLAPLPKKIPVRSLQRLKALCLTLSRNDAGRL